jgi:hypothetical protein
MILLRNLFLIFLLSFGGSVIAQPGGGPCPPRDPDCQGKPVPISGIEILLLTGGLLGVRRMIKSKKGE